MRGRPLGGGGGGGIVVIATDIPLDSVLAVGASPGNIFVADSIIASGTPAADARGAGSIDLQIARTASTQITSGQYAVIVGGNDNTASGTESAVIGGFSNTASGTRSTVGGGSSNVASKTNASVGGGATNTASGTEAYVGGGGDNVASGTNSVVAGGDTNKASNISAGVAAGGSNTASGIFAFVGGGGGNTASATYATVGGGQNNTASAQGATVAGGSTNTCSGLYSWSPGGWQGAAPLYGMGMWSAGMFAAVGDCQVIYLHARNTTTDATPTDLFLNGSSNRLVIPSGYIWALMIEVLGVSDDGTKGAHYCRKVTITNIGGTTALMGAVSTIGTDQETDAGLDVTITADDTNDAVDISVTGLAATNMRWTAHIQGLQEKMTT